MPELGWEGIAGLDHSPFTKLVLDALRHIDDDQQTQTAQRLGLENEMGEAIAVLQMEAQRIKREALALLRTSVLRKQSTNRMEKRLNTQPSICVEVYLSPHFGLDAKGSSKWAQRNAAPVLDDDIAAIMQSRAARAACAQEATLLLFFFFMYTG